MRREPPEPDWGGPAPARAEDAGRVDLEFGLSTHPDGRVRTRMAAMARAWERRPGEPVPAVFPGEAERKAAYRFLSSPKVTMDGIPGSHRAATAPRRMGGAGILAVRDTTMPDLARRPGRACPGTRAFAVCGREGDIWDMSGAQAGDPGRGGTVDLREHAAALPVVGTRDVRIAARGGTKATKGRKAVKARPERTAVTGLRAGRVRLPAPGRSGATLPVTVVPVRETSTPPEGRRPLRRPPVRGEGEDGRPPVRGRMDHRGMPQNAETGHTRRGPPAWTTRRTCGGASPSTPS